MSLSADSAWLAETKEVLRERLFGTKRTFGSDGALDRQLKAISTLHDLLLSTITRGEGNSLLIIGPSGSGKSWVLEQALLKVSHHPQSKGNFLTVQLNGLIHTNDRLALLDIAKQLDINEDLGEKISLSFSAALDYLLTALREGDHSKQSIVFVLDNFDLFTNHKNQTLLYNLFDNAQSARNPIAVVGLTCRLDTVELLEKRVKSRFSHRQLTLFCDHTFEEYLQLFATLLSLPDQFSDCKHRDKWNSHIQDLTKNVTVRESLRRVYNTSPDIRSLINLLTVPLCRLGLREDLLRPSDFAFSVNLVQKESVSAILCGLSILELCLVIAMKHLGDVSGDEPSNFEMVYNEYKKFTQRSHSVEFFDKPVALKAFEHLIALELVCPADSSGFPTTSRHANRTMKEYQSVVLMLGEDQFREAVQSYPNCPTDVQRWGSTAGMA